MENFHSSTGVVTKSTGSFYTVQLASGETWNCRMLGKYRLLGMKLTNPVAVGDKVVVTKGEGDEFGLIQEILPRQNYIVRQSPRQKHYLHLLAANIDQAALVVTLKQPMLKQGFIDRFLLMTEPHNVPAGIIFNKSDLYDEYELNVFAELAEIYEKIGYEIFLTSATEQKGMDRLQNFLKDKVTLLSGQSGVGKSTLVNALIPNLDLPVSALSEFTGKGQHTTTFAQMYSLNQGGEIIDTPGIKNLSFNNLEVMDVAHNFREFFIASKDCKFANCMHINEPGCRVKEAIGENEISDLRYNNYLKIIEEIEDQNYWERHKNL